MKKKNFIIILSVFILSIKCFSQDYELKHYHDISKKFDGWAYSEYIDSLEENDLKFSSVYLEMIKCEFNDKDLKILQKISKENTWLLEQSLNEWDLKKGEIYVSFITKSQDSEEGIMFFVIIKERNEFDWIATYITEDNIEKFDLLFSDSKEE